MSELAAIASREAKAQIERNPADGVYRLNVPQEHLAPFNDGYKEHISNPLGTLYITEEKERNEIRKEAWFLTE